MLRRSSWHLTILLLLAGLALRAIVPLGYMPSTLGSGHLFELCPDQLPAGFTFSSSGSHHHHHDPANAQSGEQAADLCDFGHLLISAIGLDQPAIEIHDALPPVAVVPTIGTPPALVALRGYLSRAPPA